MPWIITIVTICWMCTAFWKTTKGGRKRYSLVPCYLESEVEKKRETAHIRRANGSLHNPLSFTVVPSGGLNQTQGKAHSAPGISLATALVSLCGPFGESGGSCLYPYHEDEHTVQMWVTAGKKLFLWDCISVEKWWWSVPLVLVVSSFNNNSSWTVLTVYRSLNVLTQSPQ